MGGRLIVGLVVFNLVSWLLIWLFGWLFGWLVVYIWLVIYINIYYIESVFESMVIGGVAKCGLIGTGWYTECKYLGVITCG